MDQTEKDMLLGGLLALCSPEKVILHGAKRGITSGRLKTASLCIVVPDCDKKELLRRLYLELPLDFQVNINLYTHLRVSGKNGLTIRQPRGVDCGERNGAVWRVAEKVRATVCIITNGWTKRCAICRRRAFC